MPKFCGFCGTQSGDNDFICSSCGRPLDQQSAQAVNSAPVQYTDYAEPAEEFQSYYTQQPESAAKKTKIQKKKLNIDFNKLADSVTTKLAEIVAGVKKGDKKSMITAGGAAAAVLAVLIVIISIFSVPGEKKAAEKVLKAMDKDNAQAVIKLVPKFYYGENILGYTQSEEDWTEIFDEKIELFRNTVSDNLNSNAFTMKWEITDVDFYGDKEMGKLADAFEIYEDFKPNKLKKGALINVEVLCKKGGEKYYSELEIYAYKYGSKWYVQSWTGLPSVQN